MILVRRSGRIRTFFTIRQYTITKWNLQLFFTGFSVEYEEFLGGESENVAAGCDSDV